MAQLMPLPLAVSCFSKIQIGFTFLVPAYLGIPGQRAVKWVCVCVCDDFTYACSSGFFLRNNQNCTEFLAFPFPLSLFSCFSLSLPFTPFPFPRLPIPLLPSFPPRLFLSLPLPKFQLGIWLSAVSRVRGGAHGRQVYFM